MTFKSLLKRLQYEGWVIKEWQGSHIQLIHSEKKGKITIPAHGKRDLKPGTLNAILKQAGLK